MPNRNQDVNKWLQQKGMYFFPCPKKSELWHWVRPFKKNTKQNEVEWQAKKMRQQVTWLLHITVSITISILCELMWNRSHRKEQNIHCFKHGKTGLQKTWQGDTAGWGCLCTLRYKTAGRRLCKIIWMWLTSSACKTMRQKMRNEMTMTSTALMKMVVMKTGKLLWHSVSSCHWKRPSHLGMP